MKKAKEVGANNKKHRTLRKKNLNSYGYDVSQFVVLDIPVRRDPQTGLLVSTDKNPLDKNR